MDVILKAQGLTRGSVGERMTALGRDPKAQQPTPDERRAALVAQPAPDQDGERARFGRRALRGGGSSFATSFPTLQVSSWST